MVRSVWCHPSLPSVAQRRSTEKQPELRLSKTQGHAPQEATMKRKKEAAFSVSQRLLYLPTFVLFTMKVTRKSIRFDVYFLCKWAVKRFVVGNVQKFISETLLTDDMLDFSAMHFSVQGC